MGLTYSREFQPTTVIHLDIDSISAAFKLIEPVFEREHNIPSDDIGGAFPEIIQLAYPVDTSIFIQQVES